VHLVGFIIRIYHDARTPECQKSTTLYIQQLVYVIHLCRLAVGRIGVDLATASQHKLMTYTNCCIYRVVPPDDKQ